MKVPTVGLPQVSPSGGGLSAPRVEYAGGREALARGLSDIGRAVDQVGQGIAREQQIAREQAIAKESTDGETELTHYATEKFNGRKGSGDARRDAIEGAFNGEEVEQPGYLNLRGDDAFDASTNVNEDLKKKQREIADNLSTPEARKLFMDRTARQMEGYYETVERHAGHQRQVANLASVEARKNAALETVRANPDNDKVIDNQTNALAGPIYALGLSDDDRAAKVREWQGEVAVTQIAAQLDGPGGWRSAEKTFAEKGGALPEKARQALGSTIEKRKASALALGAADSIAKAATDPDTRRIDQDKALELLSKADMDPEVKKVAGDRLDHLIIENGKAWTQRVNTTYQGAFSTYLRTRQLSDVDPTMREWLVDHAPEKWDELEQKQKRDREYQKKLLRGENNEGESASEARALIELKSDVVRNPDKYADMSPADFDSEWGARLSPSGYKQGGTLFANASKGDRLSDGEFSTYVNEQVRTNPMFFANPNNRQEKEAKKRLAAGFRADFGDARRAFKEQNKRNPTMAEVQGPEFQKTIWTNALRRNGIQLGDAPPSEKPKPSGLVLPELDFSGDQPAPAMIRVRNKKTNATGKMPSTKFNPDLYERVDG